MRTLITGISGFVGSYLAESLLAQGVEVWGTHQPGANIDNLQGLVNRVNLLEYDLLSNQGAELIARVQPEIVFHLAAQSSVGRSWDDKEETINANVNGTVRLLEGIRETGIEPRILLIGSAEEYGLVKPEETPIKEGNPMRPLSPYGVSKLAAGLLALQYHRAYGLEVIHVRAFNHIGPRQALGFVTSDFAKQVAEIEACLLEPVIMVGNLEAQRDFTDVRDVVRAYRLLADRGKPGEIYNVASGKGVPVARVLEILLSLAKVPIRVEKDPARMRPSDVPILVGDISKIQAETGWQPEISLEQSLQEVLDYWRNHINKVHN
ncbi:MAG: GDP-mannose 4,6-dehydratase [Clostridia bacterium]|nr:GDP-mannose 4,6-dehydratase [Clostridia bacterium]